MLQDSAAKRGFTLVEILIALAILAMIVVSTFAIFKSSSSSWRKGEARSERYKNARVALGKMSMEISQAIVAENKNGELSFKGEKEDIAFISFVSSGDNIFEKAEVEYWLDHDRKILLRNEDLEPDYDFSTYDYSDILADNISKLEFSYFDGKTWMDRWGSLTDLPQAVKIHLRVEVKGEGEDFNVIARLKTI